VISLKKYWLAASVKKGRGHWGGADPVIVSFLKQA